METHTDLNQAKFKPDANGLQSVMDYLIEGKPFTNDSKELHILSSGVISERLVHVAVAETVGTAILTSMEGMSVAKHKLCKTK